VPRLTLEERERGTVDSGRYGLSVADARNHVDDVSKLVRNRTYDKFFNIQSKIRAQSLSGSRFPSQSNCGALV
jgi:hypothetical protein